MAAFAEGHMDAEYQGGQLIIHFSSDVVVAGCIDAAWNWSTLVVEAKKDAWRAHTVPGAAEGEERLGVVLRPTTITKGNGVFLLAGSSDASYVGVCRREGGLELKLVVGDVTNPTGGKQSGRIEWGDSKPPSKLISSASREAAWTEFIASGGSGVAMEDGTLVFPLVLKSEAEDVCSSLSLPLFGT
ncbi:trans-sialidase, putative [Trypanosoma cruzi marinkellei]|uniref:Trans-sialidase, putative n=1 Tax=Trypanosoma cruzi marinkellei TaxID=85056 RepID=K2MQD1_TRYCR|nr:trans-sialidase, putative [Trypanosoma cruzi marinkellei]